jgi:hypothetical protein
MHAPRSLSAHRRHDLSAHGRRHAAVVDAAAFPPPPPGAHNHPVLGFADIYATVGVIGLRLGPGLRALAGGPVRVRGYMAPPIAEADDFFVLTRSPVTTCPFCDPGAQWPDDVVLALLERDSHFVDPSCAIEVMGELDIGAKVDPRTGATRLVRLTGARWHPIARPTHSG